MPDALLRESRELVRQEQHVSSLHAPYLEAEKGPLGMDLMRAMAREFDPDGMMNPGKLLA